MGLNIAMAASIALLLSSIPTVLPKDMPVPISKASPPIDSVQQILSRTWPMGADVYASIRRQQRKTSGPIIVYFYADWCGFCKRLGRDILITPEVQGFLKGVPHVRINAQLGERERALSEGYDVKGFPTFYIVSSDSTRRIAIHPFHKGVGLPPNQFVQACQQAIAELRR